MKVIARGAVPVLVSGAHGDRRGKPFGARFVTPLYTGAALNPVNSSMIATALVPIAASLDIPVGRTAILISSLYLTSAIAQPAAGRLAEVFGPRRVFLTGTLIVLAAGVIGAIAWNLPVLVLSRVLIGAGTSAAYPSAMLLIRRRATAVGLQDPPGNVLGGLAVAGAATVAIGPAVGGLLVGGLGWQTAFLVNVPAAGAAFAMALLWIDKDPARAGGRSPRELAVRIDVVGMAGFAGALTSLLVFLTGLPTPDWTALAAAVVLAGALVAWELRAARPFLDVRLLASKPALTRTYLRNGLTLMGTYVILYGLTQWLEAAHGLSAYQAGLVLVPMGALSAVTARIASRRTSVRGVLIGSAVLLLLGAAAALPLTAHTPVAAVVAVTALFGLTSGASTVANQTVLYRESPPESVGTASGLLRTFGYIGSIASAAITGIAFHSRVDDTGLHRISWSLVAIGAVVLLMTVFDRHLAGVRQGSAAAVDPPVRHDHTAEPHRSGDPRLSESTDMTTPAQPVVASRTALLLMDFQPAVLAAVPDGEAVLARAQQALAWARSLDIRVVHVRVAFAPEDFAAVPDRNKSFAPVARHGFLADGSPEADLHDALDVREGDVVVRKVRVGAFSAATGLHPTLLGQEIDTLVLAGLSTSGVVLSTVRHAADEDYRLYVLKDATGDPDPEVHRVLTERVFPSQADVITTDDLSALGKQA
ncbi:MFS transporter [Streptomyces sp. NPDC088197]|uniref:MFS transporter n=1 Tax=Streptomyces sp. NPDC088197 TaxID=3365840 RepID=UPI0038133F15